MLKLFNFRGTDIVALSYEVARGTVFTQPIKFEHVEARNLPCVWIYSTLFSLNICIIYSQTIFKVTISLNVAP